MDVKVKRTVIIGMAAALLIGIGLLICCRKSGETLSGRLNSLSKVSELGTVEYTFSRIYSVDGSAWYKPGERKALFEAEARVKAGIRMDGFSRNSVVIYDGSVTVTLPAAEILSFNMPPEKIRMVYSHVSPFRDEFTAEEKVQHAQAAEAGMRAAVDSSDILTDAENNAVMFFKSMFTHFGYDPEAVEIKFEKHE